jgi:MFS family permease
MRQQGKATTRANGTGPVGVGLASDSALAPLREPLFRDLWTASVVSNFGTWMQNVGAAWLMTTLTPSPLLIALMTAATSLPMCLLGLPAGALADLVDRRRLLLVAQGWMLLAAGLLGVLTLAGLTTPWTLLALTFALGLGGALNSPAWQAITPEIVNRRRLGAAVALNSAGFNLARAVGPAAGGLVVAALGPAINFLLNAASFLATIVVLFRWKRPPSPTSPIPAEPLFGATLAGIRYARYAPELRAVLFRCAAFIACASALWALMPLVVRDQLGLDSSGYGILLGALGVGAVAGAGLMPRLSRWLAVDQRVAAASVVFGIATIALGYLPNLFVLCLFMLAAGLAWMVITNGFNVAAQTYTPAWVRARALGAYLVVFQGCLAAGSVIWGVVAERLGEPGALGLAGAGMVLAAAATRRWRLEAGAGMDFRPSRHLPLPDLPTEPESDEGPVLVTSEFDVPDGHVDAFIAAMQDVGRLRRRDGAQRWGLFRDPAVPGRFVESFVVDSWAEHLRQHERATLTDKAIDERARALASPEPVVSHLIAARPTQDA